MTRKQSPRSRAFTQAMIERREGLKANPTRMQIFERMKSELPQDLTAEEYARKVRDIAKALGI